MTCGNAVNAGDAYDVRNWVDGYGVGTMFPDVSVALACTRYEPPEAASFQVVDHVVDDAPGEPSVTENHLMFAPQVPVPGCHHWSVTRFLIAISTVDTATLSFACPEIASAAGGTVELLDGCVIVTVGATVSCGPPVPTEKFTWLDSLMFPEVSVTFDCAWYSPPYFTLMNADVYVPDVGDGAFTAA